MLYKYSTTSNIKSKLFQLLKLEDNFEIKSVDDISVVQQAIGKYIPYDNSDLLINQVNEFSDEYCIDRLMIKQIGGTCLHMTVLFGLLLTECGFDVQLTKAINSKEQLSELVQYHYTNIVVVDGKRYLVDASMGLFNSYIPIELGKEEPVEFLTTSYRVIKCATDNSFSFEQKRVYEQVYTTTYKFIDETVDADIIKQSQVEYKNHAHTHLLFFILVEGGGHYFIMKNALSFITNFAAPVVSLIADNNEYQQILSTKFNNYATQLNNIDFYSFDLKKCQQ